VPVYARLRDRPSPPCRACVRVCVCNDFVVCVCHDLEMYVCGDCVMTCFMCVCTCVCTLRDRPSPPCRACVRRPWRAGRGSSAPCPLYGVRCTHTHMHTHTHTHTRTHTHKVPISMMPHGRHSFPRTHTHMYIYIHVYMHTYVRTYTRAPCRDVRVASC
jgi:hypothetical protein